MNSKDNKPVEQKDKVFMINTLWVPPNAVSVWRVIQEYQSEDSKYKLKELFVLARDIKEAQEITDSNGLKTIGIESFCPITDTSNDKFRPAKVYAFP